MTVKWVKVNYILFERPGGLESTALGSIGLHLRNKKALIVPCSIANHFGSGYSTEEVRNTQDVLKDFPNS